MTKITAKSARERLGTMLPALLMIFTLLAIIPVTHLLVMRATKATVQSVVADYTVMWANFLTASSGELRAVADGWPPSSGLVNDIEGALAHSDVVGFTLYGLDGTPFLVADADGVSNGMAEYVSGFRFDQRSLPPEFLRDGVPFVQLGAENTADEQISNAVVPLFGQNGDVRGLVDITIDASDISAIVFKDFAWLAYLLPLFCALIYLLPSYGFLRAAHSSATKTKHMLHLAHRDPLTEVLNRASFEAAADAQFEMQRKTRKALSVMSINVDLFKTVNDDHGHTVGDAYLTRLATLLSAFAGPNAIVGRLGGDEFVVLLPGAEAEQSARIANRILKAARTTIFLGDIRITNTLSIGTHQTPPDETMEVALAASDMALNYAKTRGRDRVEAYFPEMNEKRERHKYVMSALRDGAQNDHLQMYFQPLVASETGRIVGFEALMRLWGPDGEAIPPTEFIPIAEDSGLIHEIGLCGLERAVTQALAWPENITLSVNLSPVQFLNRDLSRHVGEILEKTGFAPARLELEVTESVLLDDEEAVSDLLMDLKALGVSIAMDDFGTGYSSLGYLWRFRFDKLKIDRAFLEAYSHDPQRNRHLLETIVILGHRLDMTITAEGVETRDQWDLLKAMGCDQLQGFYFSRPIPGPRTPALLQAQDAPQQQSA